MIGYIAGAAVGAWLLSRGGGVGGGAPIVAAGPASHPGLTPRPDGKIPGTVTIGGKPGGDAWSPGASIAQKAVGLTGVAAGIAGGLGIGSAGGIIGASTFGASGTMLGSLIPGIGIGVAVIGTVLGIISAHHQAALKREGQVLNETDPGMLNALVMVAQGVILGEIHSVAEAKLHTDQIVADWYGQVKTIQRGKWPYKGDNIAKLDYVAVWKNRIKDPSPDAHAPDPCNGACVIGHFFAERNALVVLATVKDILAGNHGTMIFPEIPSHETQSGFPEIRMDY